MRVGIRWPEAGGFLVFFQEDEAPSQILFIEEEDCSHFEREVRETATRFATVFYRFDAADTNRDVFDDFVGGAIWSDVSDFEQALDDKEAFFVLVE